jgi:predicted signal transduction protein with EAL and GGDEF domain
MSQYIRTWRFITLMLTAFSLSLSMTHLLELPQRMHFDQQLWVRVTVVENVYKLFGTVGAAFEITAILTAILLAFLVRRRGSTFYWTLSGAILLVLAFVSWIVFIAPMNAEFAKWLTNPIPADWTRYRDRWEYAHALNAVIKIIAVGSLAISVLVETPQKLGKRHLS